jgi:hypothetical protein
LLLFFLSLILIDVFIYYNHYSYYLHEFTPFVGRPDIAGLMGAYGMALVARDRYYVKYMDKLKSIELSPSSSSLPSSDGFAPYLSPLPCSTVLPYHLLSSFTTAVDTARCGGCGNNCLLTINTFSDGRMHVSGNRCERGAERGPDLMREKEKERKRRAALMSSASLVEGEKGSDSSSLSSDSVDAASNNMPAKPAVSPLTYSGLKISQVPNMHKFKNIRLFSYFKPLAAKDGIRATIGIPRVLNMYDFLRDDSAMIVVILIIR